MIKKVFGPVLDAINDFKNIMSSLISIMVRYIQDLIECKENSSTLSQIGGLVARLFNHPIIMAISIIPTIISSIYILAAIFTFGITTLIIESVSSFVSNFVINLLISNVIKGTIHVPDPSTLILKGVWSIGSQLKGRGDPTWDFIDICSIIFNVWGILLCLGFYKIFSSYMNPSINQIKEETGTIQKGFNIICKLIGKGMPGVEFDTNEKIYNEETADKLLQSSTEKGYDLKGLKSAKKENIKSTGTSVLLGILSCIFTRWTWSINDPAQKTCIAAFSFAFSASGAYLAYKSLQESITGKEKFINGISLAADIASAICNFMSMVKAGADWYSSKNRP